MKHFRLIFLSMLVLTVSSISLQAQNTEVRNRGISVYPTEFHVAIDYIGFVTSHLAVGSESQTISVSEEILQGGNGWTIPTMYYSILGGSYVELNFGVDSVEITNPSEPYKRITIGAIPADTTIEILIYKDILSSIEEPANYNIYIYPNPVSKTLFIKNITSNDIVKVYNQAGILVVEKEAVNNDFELDVSTFPNGIYIIKIGDEVQKIIKQ